MKKQTVKNADNGKTLKKLWGHIAKFRVLLILSVIMAAATVILQLYVPILFGDAIDNIVAAGQVDFARVGYYLKRVLVLASLSGVSGWTMSILNNRMTYRVVQDIRAQSIRHIQHLPLSYLDQHSTGDIVSRIIADADILSDGLLLGFTQLFSGVVTIVVTLIFMFSKNFWITLLVICLTPVSFWVAKFISSHSYGMFRKQSEARGKQTALIDEIIGNQKVVRAYGYEERASRRFAEINGELRDYSAQAVFYSSLTNPCTRFVNSVVYALVALSGALFALAGGITVGSLTILLNYANQYTKPFNEISGVITELQNALACAGRVFDLIETPARTPEPEHPQKPEKVSGAVEIRDLKFSYTPDRELIRDFNLSVKPGQRIAIVGPTGCGKTTFINLLMRFYDPQGGSICLDGVNTRDMTRRDLRRSVGMVLQDTWLKAGTIRENIAMGRPEATLDEVVAAAKQAHAHSFIKRLPQGYDTVISENGGDLSQGQKQLLCIARVMLCLPPMLFLDEATSSIDTRTEIRIQKAFDTMMRGRTTFIVAHRLSTIREVDLILVMKDGKIIEQGNHQQLLKQGGFYKNLYESQFAH